MAQSADYWNHNVHYQPVILGAVPPGCAAAINAAAVPANHYYKLVRGEGTSGAPVMEPGMTWAQARETARRVLPGVRYRRHLLWRYSLCWDKPA